MRGVRYVVPATIIPEGPRATYTLSLRSDGVYAPATIEVLADGKVIRSTVQRRIIVPGEMERVRFVVPEGTKEIGVTIRGVLC